MAGTHRLAVSSSASDAVTRTDDCAGGGPVFSLDTSHTFTDGLNAGQVGHVYAASITLAASGTQTIDLYGSLLSTAGETINGSRLRYIKVVNVTGPGAVSVSRPGANGVTFLLAAGDATCGLEEGDWFEMCWPKSSGPVITNTMAQDITFTETSTTSGVTFKVLLGVRGI